MSDAPQFPPLLTGVEAPQGQSPFDKALALAAMGCDAGTLVYAVRDDMLDAALVLTPECPLEDAMAMVMVAGLGFADSLGALGPPEVAVHLCWPGDIRVNGARCGGLRAAAATMDAMAEPDWLVVGLSVPFMALGAAPGEDPDRTTLYEEGCAEVLPKALLESWARHSLSWINRWMDDGMPPVHAAWRSKAHGIGEDVSLTVDDNTKSGVFMGLDERGGMLLRGASGTDLVPLTTMLEP